MRVSMTMRKTLVELSILVFAATPAAADNFASVIYDPKTDEIVLTMIYRGTNPKHEFAVRWGPCQHPQDAAAAQVSGEVVDSQWKDAEQKSYRKITRIGLADIPCRPADVTLRTAPRFFYTLHVPAPAGP